MRLTGRVPRIADCRSPLGEAPLLSPGKMLTIAVVSGKGGVGKTNIAVNLAFALNGRGLRVSLVDLDLGLANADVLLGVQSRHTLSHVVSGARSLADVAVELRDGLRFVPGASGVHRLRNLTPFERQNLLRQLRLFAADSDVVIYDCGAGLSPNVTDFARAADRILVVTTPEPTAVTDAYAIVKVMVREGYHGSIGLILNRTADRKEALQVYDRLRAAAERFLEYPIADDGFVAQDNHVELAVRQRCPFVIRYPRCPASSCMALVADGLVNGCAPRPARGGFFRQVAGLFA